MFERCLQCWVQYRMCRSYAPGAVFDFAPRRAAPRMGPTGFSLCLTQDGEVDRVMDRLS